MCCLVGSRSIDTVLDSVALPRACCGDGTGSCCDCNYLAVVVCLVGVYVYKYVYVLHCDYYRQVPVARSEMSVDVRNSAGFLVHVPLSPGISLGIVFA